MGCKWQHASLGDICRLVGGSAFPRRYQGQSEGVPFIKVSDMNLSSNGWMICKASNHVNEKVLVDIGAKKQPRGATVFAKIGEALKADRTRMLTTETAIDNNMMAAIPKSGTDKWFLYYLISWLRLSNYAEGSALPYLKQSTLNKIPITLPNSEVAQRKVVEILYELDSQIKLNTAQNGYLEELARTLYHEIGNDHSHPAELAQIAQVNPETYSPKEAWETISYIDTSSLTNNECDSMQVIKPSEEKLPSRARRKVKRGDVLYSTVRPNQKHYGLLENVPHDALASTAFAVIRTESKWSPLVYLALTESSVIEALQQLAETSTSTIPSIRPSDLGEIEVTLPSDAEGEYLNSQIRLCYQLFAANSLENNRLVELRDSLLPKLMTGEIDVSGVELTPPNSHLYWS